MARLPMNPSGQRLHWRHAVAATPWLVLLVAGRVWAETAADAWVLPPGQEQAVLGILGGGAPLGGCVVDDVGIRASSIEVRWRCPTGTQQARLVRSTVLASGVQLADDATLTAPLRQALGDRLSAAAAQVVWSAGGTASPAAAPADVAHAATEARANAGAAPQGNGWPAEVEALYHETEALLREGRTWTRLDALRGAAARVPDSLILGRLVVAAAERVGQPDGPTWVDRMLAESDAHRDDPVLQFVAGVSVHYRGHTRGTTLAAKRADYRDCIARLERVRTVYAHNARLWLYLAVSYLRTGQDAKARDAIDRSVAADAGSDADVYYCRAEVWHRSDPRRALADIGRYQQLMASNRARGAWSAPGKEERVARMRAVLQDVVDGRGRLPPADQDLFDPLLQPRIHDPPSHWPRLAALAVAAAGLLAVVAWRRRRQV